MGEHEPGGARMRHVSTLVIYSLIGILLTGCGAAEFTGTNANSKSTTDGADGTLGQGANDDANGNLASDDNDDADGNFPQLTADEAAGMVLDLLNGADPSAGALEQIVEGEMKDLRCYISGSGGHGIDMCMADTTPIRHLAKRQEEEGTYLEIKGSQLCVPLQLLLKEKALLATAVTGECP